jgi:endoglucanase
MFGFTSVTSAAPVMSTASRNLALEMTPILGVNLSGCEFMVNGALCPTPADVEIYLAKAQANDPTVIAKMKAVAYAASARGAYIILDRHDYGATFDADSAAWWGSLIKNFPDSSHVMIDTMNEPKTGAPYERDATGTSYACR